MSQGAAKLNRWAARMRADRTGRKLATEIEKLPAALQRRVKKEAGRALGERLSLLPSHPRYRDRAIELLAELKIPPNG